MSAHFIPPRGEHVLRLEQAKHLLREALRPFITSRSKTKKLEEAVDASFKALRPILNLPKKPENGATMMTESASQKNSAGKFTKGPKSV